MSFKFFIFSGFMPRFGAAGSSGTCVAVKREKKRNLLQEKEEKKKKERKREINEFFFFPFLRTKKITIIVSRPEDSLLFSL